MSSVLALPALIEPLFVAAGWKQPAPEAIPVFAEVTAEQLAIEILRLFGGLRVGEAGPGREQTASDVRFYSALRPEVSAVVVPWLVKVGNCSAFATAHNDHMILLASDEGSYFVFTDADECLYCLGSSFGNAMQALLWGYSYGAPLARDA